MEKFLLYWSTLTCAQVICFMTERMIIAVKMSFHHRVAGHSFRVKVMSSIT